MIGSYSKGIHNISLEMAVNVENGDVDFELAYMFGIRIKPQSVKFNFSVGVKREYTGGKYNSTVSF